MPGRPKVNHSWLDNKEDSDSAKVILGADPDRTIRVGANWRHHIAVAVPQRSREEFDRQKVLAENGD
jgi:hypothetical protein